MLSRFSGKAAENEKVRPILTDGADFPACKRRFRAKKREAAPFPEPLS